MTMQEVDRDAVGVSGWRLHPANSVPALVHPGHSLLRELLGLGLVGREEVEGPDEAPILVPKEHLEVEDLHHAA
jgi:hypothetical protein